MIILFYLLQLAPHQNGRPATLPEGYHEALSTTKKPPERREW